MNEKFNEIVKDSMTWFTDGVDVPVGLQAKARRHLRRRRRATMSWLATGMAVAGAAAVLVGTVGAGSARPNPLVNYQGRSAPIQTTAMVISRVERALTKAAASNPVAYIQETNHGQVLMFVVLPEPRGRTWNEVDISVLRTWSRGPLTHEELLTSTGKLTLSTQTVVRSGKNVQTTIGYLQRMWTRGTFPASPATKPKLTCTLSGTYVTQAQWTREVRKLLSCGAAIAGHGRVDGVEAIKLRLRTGDRRADIRACAKADHGRWRQCQQIFAWSEFLWANASTYLPVRLVEHVGPASMQVDFRWLAPIPANLAKLRQSIPAGFRHV